MTKIELAKEAIKHIDSVYFPIYAYVSSGAKCDGGWDGEAGDLDLSKAETLELVKEEIGNHDELKKMIDVEELFQGLETKDVDVEKILSEAANEAAYPDGGPTGVLTDYVPKELKSLLEEMQSLDDSDDDYEDNLSSLKKEIQGISSGNYTFTINIEDSYNCPIAEDEELQIELSAEVARGILYNSCDNDNISIEDLFEDCDYQDTCDEDIQALVDELDFSDYVDGAAGVCNALDNYTQAWCQFIYAILTEKLTEEQLEDCLEFFDDTDFDDDSESDFDEWFEKNMEDDE